MFAVVHQLCVGLPLPTDPSALPASCRVPTFVLSECVLVYMEPQASDALLTMLARTLSTCAVAIYEQVGLLCWAPACGVFMAGRIGRGHRGLRRPVVTPRVRTLPDQAG